MSSLKDVHRRTSSVGTELGPILASGSGVAEPSGYSGYAVVGVPLYVVYTVYLSEVLILELCRYFFVKWVKVYG